MKMKSKSVKLLHFEWDKIVRLGCTIRFEHMNEEIVTHQRPVCVINWDLLHCCKSCQATHNITKYCVLEIQMICRLVQYEKLGAISVWSTICHTDNSPSWMKQFRVELIFKRLPPNRLSSPSSASWITPLNHEIPIQWEEDECYWDCENHAHVHMCV